MDSVDSLDDVKPPQVLETSQRNAPCDSAELHETTATQAAALRKCETEREHSQAALEATRTALETTRTTLETTRTTLNDTLITLTETETTLKDTQNTLKDTQIALNDTQTALKGTKDGLHYAQQQLESIKKRYREDNTALPAFVVEAVSDAVASYFARQPPLFRPPPPAAITARISHNQPPILHSAASRSHSPASAPYAPDSVPLNTSSNQVHAGEPVLDISDHPELSSQYFDLLLYAEDEDDLPPQKDFGVLDMSVQNTLRRKIERDYCMLDIPPDDNAMANRRRAFINFVKKGALRRSVATRTCISRYLYIGNRAGDLDKDLTTACDKCTNMGKICMRLVEVGDDVKFCIYPYPGQHHWQSLEHLVRAGKLDWHQMFGNK